MGETFEEYLNQANEPAERGDVPAALAWLQQANQAQPEQAGVLTGMGRCLVELNDPQAALECFLQAAVLLPDNADAQNNLGLAYQVNGLDQQALASYQAAVQLDSAHWQAWRNLAVMHLRLEQWEQGVQILASLIRTNPADIDAKFLMAQCYEIGRDFVTAQAMYEAVLAEDPDHTEAKAALENLTASTFDAPESPVGAQPRAEQRVVVYAAEGMPGELRMELVTKALAGQGASVSLRDHFTPGDTDQFDYFIFSQPNLAPEWINAVQACLRAGKPFGVDMEQDYFSIPTGHPAYMLFGPGNPQALQALEVILQAAAWVSVASHVLAERMQHCVKDVRYNPPSWDRSSPFWRAAAQPHDTLNIGWIGSQNERDDMFTVRDEVVRFLRGNPNAKIIIAGDNGIFQRFGSLPEKQRQYLPVTSARDIPQILSQFDILLAPWQMNSFNQAKSDQALLEAGICQVPWVASPLPSYQEWGAGGLFAAQPGEWAAALEQLAASPDLRRRLGAAGWEQANRR